jgi:TonB family protein
MNKHSLLCRFIYKIIVIMAYLALWTSPQAVKAQVPSAGLSTAVDAQGVRHQARDYGAGKHPPWMDDAIKTVAPEYPYEARSRHIQGNGLFRLSLDLNTGSVSKVTAIRSTGSPILDNSAVAAFHRWRWKPGRWKEIDFPITFAIAPAAARLPPSAIPIPARP